MAHSIGIKKGTVKGNGKTISKDVGRVEETTEDHAES